MAYKNQTFQTTDGKIVVYDPNTGQASVHTPMTKFVGPTPAPSDLIALLQSLMPPQVKIVDFMIIGDPGTGTGKTEDPKKDNTNKEDGDAPEDDILGPIDYYILVPKEGEKLLHSIFPVPINAWVTEHKNGHKPDYKGYNKHRILPEQFKWLNQHKDCPVVAWYDEECPVFASLACQTHAKTIQPRIPQGGKDNASNGSQFVGTSSIVSQQESIGTEEREV